MVFFFLEKMSDPHCELCSVPFIACQCAGNCSLCWGSWQAVPCRLCSECWQGHCDCMGWLNTTSPAPEGVAPSSPCLHFFFPPFKPRNDICLLQAAFLLCHVQVPASPTNGSVPRLLLRGFAELSLRL